MNLTDHMTSAERFRWTYGYEDETPRTRNKPARLDDDELSEFHWLIRERAREIGEPEPTFLERLRRAEEELEALQREADDWLAIHGRPTNARTDPLDELLEWEQEETDKYYEHLHERL